MAGVNRAAAPVHRRADVLAGGKAPQEAGLVLGPAQDVALI